ncbi:MAG: peptide ABC transporter substrate-binding protein, partial [Bacillaceae bacterium]
MRKKIVTTIIALSVMLTGCANSEGKEKVEKQKAVLNLIDVDEITSLDTIHSIDGASANATNNAMEGLYMPNEKGEFVPALATSHTVSEDGTVYTFKLRDAKWSNGEQIIADDFVFAFKKALDPKKGSQYAYMMYDILNAEAIQKGEKAADSLGIKAIDSHTLEITLKQPVPYFITLLSVPIFFPQNQAFVEKQGDKYGVYAETTLYNGPFVVSELTPGKGFKMVKNNQYYDKENVKIDEINVKLVKDTSTAVNLYESKQVDQIPVSAEFVDKYKD